jgi:hypothetical protein
MEQLFTQIEERYQFVLPEAFREFWRRGFCTVLGPGRDGPHYLDLPDLEWMPLAEIVTDRSPGPRPIDFYFLVSPRERREIFQRDLGRESLDSKWRWMQPRARWCAGCLVFAHGHYFWDRGNFDRMYRINRIGTDEDRTFNRNFHGLRPPPKHENSDWRVICKGSTK